jgi:hypothetical protein
MAFLDPYEQVNVVTSVRTKKFLNHLDPSYSRIQPVCSKYKSDHPTPAINQTTIVRRPSQQ